MRNQGMKQKNWNYARLSLCLFLALGLALALIGSILADAKGNTTSQGTPPWLRACDLPDHPQFAGLSSHTAVGHEDVIYVIGGADENLCRLELFIMAHDVAEK